MHIYISYTIHDSAFSHRLADTLRSTGHRVWLHDGTDTPSNQQLTSIQQAIAACSVFVLLVTTSALTSQQVYRELQFALSLSRRDPRPQVIPVTLEHLQAAHVWPVLHHLKRIELAPWLPYTYEDTLRHILYSLPTTEAQQVAASATAPPPQVLEQGKTLLSQHRYAEALTLLEHLTQLAPYIPLAWYLQGVACDYLGEYERAIQVYDWALYLDPEMINAWVRKGNSHQRLAQHEEALVAYEQAIGMTPLLAHAWMRKGFLFEQLERFHEALDAYQQALLLTPTTAAANIWYNAGLVLHKLSRDDEAINAFEHALQLDPQDREAQARLSVLRERHQRGPQSSGEKRSRHAVAGQRRR